jgi:hypothetical protein
MGIYMCSLSRNDHLCNVSVFAYRVVGMSDYVYNAEGIERQYAAAYLTARPLSPRLLVSKLGRHHTFNDYEYGSMGQCLSHLS